MEKNIQSPVQSSESWLIEVFRLFSGLTSTLVILYSSSCHLIWTGIVRKSSVYSSSNIVGPCVCNDSSRMHKRRHRFHISIGSLPVLTNGLTSTVETKKIYFSVLSESKIFEAIRSFEKERELIVRMTNIHNSFVTIKCLRNTYRGVNNYHWSRSQLIWLAYKRLI